MGRACFVLRTLKGNSPYAAHGDFMIRLHHLLLVLLLPSLPLLAHAESLDGHASHEHGVAQLTLAMELTTLEISLESPADNFFGFEHAPRKPGEKAAVASALASLRRPGLMKLPTDAACNLLKADVANPFSGTPNSGTANDGHRNLDAHYTFNCRLPGKVSSLDASALFKAFPRVQRIKLDHALPGSQGSTTLTPKTPIARLTP